MGLRMQVQSLWTTSVETTFDFEFAQERVVIGRSGSADVQLPHPAVSLVHATIQAQGSRYSLTDERSTNGTRVNGELIAAGRPKPLRSGDVLSIGGFRLSIHLDAAVGVSTTTERTSAVARKMVRALLDEHSEETAATLTIVHGASRGASFPLPAPPSSVVLGRSPMCDIALDDAEASREHARVVADLDGFVIEDLGSKNPLLVNGQSKSRHRLKDREEVRIGGTILVYEDPTGRRLHELTQQADEAFDMLPVPEDRPSSIPGDPPPPAEEPPSQSVRAHKLRADLAVYGLAALIVLASIAVMFWLLRTE